MFKIGSDLVEIRRGSCMWEVVSLTNGNVLIRDTRNANGRELLDLMPAPEGDEGTTPARLDRPCGNNPQRVSELGARHAYRYRRAGTWGLSRSVEYTGGVVLWARIEKREGPSLTLQRRLAPGWDHKSFIRAASRLTEDARRLGMEIDQKEQFYGWMEGILAAYPTLTDQLVLRAEAVGRTTIYDSMTDDDRSWFRARVAEMISCQPA
jgi:hypothetical protein